MNIFNDVDGVAANIKNAEFKKTIIHIIVSSDFIGETISLSDDDAMLSVRVSDIEEAIKRARIKAKKRRKR